MIFIWENHQIKSHEYGYTAQKRIGTQWKSIGHYASLEQAATDLFRHRLLTETSDCVVDATKAATIRLQSAQILQRIDQIAAEIGEGLKHEA